MVHQASPQTSIVATNDQVPEKEMPNDDSSEINKISAPPSDAPLVTITSTTTGGTWGTAATWVGGVVPVAANDVIIDGPVTVAANTTCASLTINAGKTLTINGTRNLTVTTNVSNSGTITLTPAASNAGRLTLAGNFTNNPGAYINCSSGTGTTTYFSMIIFNGSGAQTFTQNGNNASSATYTTYLQSNNTTGVTINGSSVFAGSFFCGATGAKFNLGVDMTFGETEGFPFNYASTSYVGSFNIGSNTLTLNNYFAAGSTYVINGGSNSSLVFAGSNLNQFCPPIVGGLNNLTVNNGVGLTLVSSLTVNGNLFLTSGEIMNTTSGVTLTLGNGSSVYNAGGLIYPTPAYGTAANFHYTGSTALTTGFELPASSTVLSNLVVNNSSGVTLNNAGSGSTSLLTQGFNAATLPSGWTTQVIVDGGTTGDVTLVPVTTSLYPTGITPSEGTYFLKFNSYNCAVGDQVLLKGPSFATTGYNNIIVRFDSYLDIQYINPDRIAVCYSTDGTTWTDIGGAYRFAYVGGTAAWKTYDVILPPSVNNLGAVYVGFRFTGAYGNDTHFDNVRVYGSTPVTNSITVNGFVKPTAGAFNLGNNVLTLAGTISTIGTGSVTAGGTSLVNVTGPASLPNNLFTGNAVQNLTINRSGGVTLGGNLTVNGTLSLTSGLVTTGSYTITAAGSVTGASASGYIDGKLARVYSTTGSKVFDIGKGGNYRPLTLNYSALTGTSTVTAEQTESAMSGTLPANTTLLTTGRYWTVTQTGGTDLNYYITLDATGYTPTGTVVGLKLDGGTIASYATTTPNYTNTTALTSFSDFALGDECIPPTSPTDASVDRNNFCANDPGNITLSYTGGSGKTLKWYADDCGVGTSIGSGNDLVIASPASSTTYYARWENDPCTPSACAGVTVTVYPQPTVDAISGLSDVCAGSDITLTDATPGGAWSSSDETKATVLGGVVTGVSAGAATITYTVGPDVNGCSNFVTHDVTVHALPSIAAIDGVGDVCDKGVITLTDATAGGTWSSSDETKATVVDGVVSGVSAGVVTITYTVGPDANGCSNFVTHGVTVHALPLAFAGTGSGSYCAGDPGLVVGLSGSQPGVSYSLWSSTTLLTDPPVAGTGDAISFGLQSTAGSLYVLAENTTTGCITRMDDCIVITITQPSPVGATISTPTTSVTAGQDVTFTAVAENGGSAPSYQWKVNGSDIGPNSATYTYKPANGDAVTCVITSNAACVSNNPATSNALVMTVTGIAANITVDGSVANGETQCYNATETITVAGGGNTFIVNSGGSANMIAGQNIIYYPGTTVLEGGYMLGKIFDGLYCGQKAPSVVTTTPDENAVPVVLSQSSFTLYPNPTAGKFTIEQTSGSLHERVRVEIYGMRGEKVLTGELPGEMKHDFSISGLPDGLYFVKVIAGEDTRTIKLIKTR